MTVLLNIVLYNIMVQRLFMLTDEKVNDTGIQCTAKLLKLPLHSLTFPMFYIVYSTLDILFCMMVPLHSMNTHLCHVWYRVIILSDNYHLPHFVILFMVLMQLTSQVCGRVAVGSTSSSCQINPICSKMSCSFSLLLFNSCQLPLCVCVYGAAVVL